MHSPRRTLAAWRAHARRAPARALAAGAVLAVVLAACGENAATQPEDAAPVRLLALSPVADSVTVGERLDPPVAVRVENALGEAVEGIPVRFLVATGSGEVDPMAVSNRQGIAEARFEAGSEPGPVRIRADVPSAGNVSPLEFAFLVRPSAVVDLAKLEGDGQVAEIGTQLPLPFVLRATTPPGAPAAGVAIAWSVRGDASSRLTADTTFTDGDGRTQVLLTLGPEVVEHEITVHSTGGVSSDTLRFTATAAATFTGDVRIDSVSPLPLPAGGEAVLYGSGFSPGLTQNEVRVEGEPAEVLDATSTRVRFVVPAFAESCLPSRTVGLRVLAAGRPSNGEMIALEPGRPAVSLAVGQARTLSGPAAVRCIQFAASEQASEYRIAVQSAARTGDARLPVRLVTRVGPEDDGRGASLAERPVDPEGLEGVGPTSPELRLRRSVRGELLRTRAFPARLPRAGGDSVAPAAGALRAGAPGDTLRLSFAVQPDLTASCADTAAVIRGVVRASGDHVLLVEDVNAPEGGFAAADWEQLASELDDVVYPADTAYFGSPADLDANGRVILAFTPEVNRLTPRGSPTRLGGFFLPLDLAAASAEGDGLRGPQGEACPASNEGEILYMAVADPEGTIGDAVGVAQARRNARGLAAHELQHLISAERRVFGGDGGFASLEEAWLNEALSQLAEEIVGLRVMGLRERENLGFGPFAANRAGLETFNTFHISNFFHLGLFMLDPASAPALAAGDPGGLGGLQMRGFGWFFLRWLGDQEGGGDERRLFRTLAVGGQNRLRGVENVERATGRRWEDLIADFATAVSVDDSGLEGLADRHQVLTWDFRDVFARLSENPSSGRRFPLDFPLVVTPLGAERASLAFELRASAVRFFSLSGASGRPAVAIDLGSPAGGPLAEGGAPQVTIVRTR